MLPLPTIFENEIPNYVIKIRPDFTSTNLKQRNKRTKKCLHSSELPNDDLNKKNFNLLLFKNHPKMKTKLMTSYTKKT